MNTEFFIYDEITGALARDLGERLRAKPSAPVTLFVNSYGGDLGAALAMLNSLRSHRGAITVEIEGIAASAATLFCCVGTVRMAEDAALMVHAPWVSATGNARDLRDSAEGLDRLAESMIGAYCQKTGKSRAAVAHLLAGGDHWFDAAEAQAFGLIDEIVPGLRVAARLGNSKLKIPERFNMSTENTPAEVAKIEAATLAREQTRRQDIRSLLVGVHARNPALITVMNACLDDPACSREMASQRLLAKLGESAEPLHGAMSCPPETAFVMPSGALAREFHASERAARIGNLTPFGGHGNREFIRAASDALAARMGAKIDAPHPAAADFRQTGMVGFAAMCQAARGESTLGKSSASIIHGAMTASDFPELLSSASNKALVNRFEALAADHRPLCDSGNLVDFKPAKVINTSFLPGLARKYEGGEITYGAITEGAETYQLATYARGLMLTREAMIGDDLGAFDGLVRSAANSAARLERDLVFGVLTANRAMSDGYALFHANHGNLDTTSANISAAGLSIARGLMRKQKDSSGGFVMTAPRYLVVPVALESTAEALVAAITYRPAADNEIQTPAWIRGLAIVSDPRLDVSDPADWYLLSDPRTAPVIRLGYLNGDQNPTVEQDVDFDKDVLKFKIRFDVACTAVGYAGAVKMA